MTELKRTVAARGFSGGKLWSNNLACKTQGYDLTFEAANMLKDAKWKAQFFQVKNHGLVSCYAIAQDLSTLKCGFPLSIWVVDMVGEACGGLGTCRTY